MGWYEDRFSFHPSRHECKCLACTRSFWLPASEVGGRTTCGVECRNVLRKRAKAERERPCERCGKEFTPRTTQIAVGQGRYCSISCSTVDIGQLWTPKARECAKHALQAAIASGAFVPRRGPDHAQWAGGAKATLRRRQESGKALQQLRRYRAENPGKVQEFAQRRRGLKLGRLPPGTIKRIGERQRWKCAICHLGIRVGFTADHIEPLARGGKHVPKNIQLLCKHCNSRKSAKDPIQFMQEQGFLL